MTKNLDDYDEKYIKIKFDSDDELSLNKTIEITIMTIIILSTGFLRWMSVWNTTKKLKWIERN